MLFLRSLLFNVAFYLFLIGYMIVIFPIIFFPRKWILGVLKFWGRASLWLLRTIVGLEFELRGRENLQEGGYLVAVKHQSLWETFALIPLMQDPVYILKKQLMFLPFFGWYARKYESIPVDRKGGQKALKSMLGKAEEALLQGRQIVIFPEGTRRPPGAPAAYKSGITALYKALNAPVAPVAHNAGLFWPRRSFLRYPGTVVVEILPPIPPGLPEKAFRKKLVESIETASNRLLQEARATAPYAPCRSSSSKAS